MKTYLILQAQFIFLPVICNLQQRNGRVMQGISLEVNGEISAYRCCIPYLIKKLVLLMSDILTHVGMGYLVEQSYAWYNSCTSTTTSTNEPCARHVHPGIINQLLSFIILNSDLFYS